MANLKIRQGKSSELQVFGQAMDAGLDCYQPLTDDQAIDALIRVVGEDGLARYFEVQIKSARSWAGIRGRVAALANRVNTILILFNSSTKEVLWLDPDAIRSQFPQTSSTWGDIFLNATLVKEMQAEGRGDLDKLRSILEGWNGAGYSGSESALARPTDGAEAPVSHSAERDLIERSVMNGAPPGTDLSDGATSPRAIAESTLIQEISQGFPTEFERQYRSLAAKRDAETLSPAEHEALISLTDQIEAASVNRLEKLIELAQLRGVPLRTLMDQLGISPTLKG